MYLLLFLYRPLSLSLSPLSLLFPHSISTFSIPPPPPRFFFSLLFRSKFSLSHQERNKPIEPPKAPEAAPFFLQTSLAPTSASKFAPVPTAENGDGESSQEEEVEGVGVRWPSGGHSASRSAGRSERFQRLYDFLSPSILYTVVFLFIPFCFFSSVLFFFLVDTVSNIHLF